MNTHTNKTSLKQCPVHRCVLKCHVHTHRFVHIRRTLPLHSKHTHSPTHMKNKHSHEIHPHMKTHTQSWSRTHSTATTSKCFVWRRLTCTWGTFCGVRGGEESGWEAGGGGAHGWEVWLGGGGVLCRCWGGRCVCCGWAFWAGGAKPWFGAGTPCWLTGGPWKPMGAGCRGCPLRETCCWAWRRRWSPPWLTVASWGPGSRDRERNTSSSLAPFTLPIQQLKQ